MTRSIRPAAAPHPNMRPRLHRRLRAILRLPAALLVAGWLAACASDPAPARMASAGGGDCASVDWNAQGVADGSAGRSSEGGLARLSGCPRLPNPEDAQDAYLAGHDEGRALYCSPENARALGVHRQDPTLTCPEPLSGPFETAYAEGLRAPAEAPPPAARAEDPPLALRVRPYFSIGSAGGWSGASWGIGLVF